MENQLHNQEHLLPVKPTGSAQTKQVLQRWIVKATILLIPLHSFAVCAKTFAMPGAAIVPTLSPESGNGAPSIRLGLGEHLTPAYKNEVISINTSAGNPHQSVYVPNAASIHLKFREGNTWQGPLVQARGEGRSAEYLFPCSLSPGTFTIGWGLMETGGRDGCSQIKIARSRQSAQTLLPSSIASKQIPVQPTPPAENSVPAEGSTPEADSVTVAPVTREATLVQIQNFGYDGAEIRALVGNVTIVSPNTPRGLTLPEGSGYSTATGQESKLDCGQIFNSPAIKSFLDPQNWVDSSTTSDAQPIGDLLKRYKNGFCPPPRSSRPSSGPVIIIGPGWPPIGGGCTDPAGCR
jgi:hypothetical protein